MTRGLWLLAAVLLLPGRVDACRCAPQTLATYFAQAEAVTVAMLVGSQDVDRARVLNFATPPRWYKPVPAPALEEFSVRTARSTAACGIVPQPGATYLVFRQAADHAGQPGRVDSCSGTRVLLGPASPPAEFIDVPARHVPAQLNGLAGLEVLRAVVAAYPNRTDSANTTLVGLLDIKTLAHGGPVGLHAGPAADAPRIATITDIDQLRVREAAYEAPAAVFFAHADGWYKVALAGGDFGWVGPHDVGSVFTYPQLAVNRLGYLTAAWSGLVWPDAGAGLPRWHQAGPRAQRRDEHPARVLAVQEVGGYPWLQVEVLNGDECQSTPAVTSLTGWVPAYGHNGQPNAWFYSRGC